MLAPWSSERVKDLDPPLLRYTEDGGWKRISKKGKKSPFAVNQFRKKEAKKIFNTFTFCFQRTVLKSLFAFFSPDIFRSSKSLFFGVTVKFLLLFFFFYELMKSHPSSFSSLPAK